jgi:uncharacterized protein
MRVELVHALADEQHLLALDLPEGATLADAIEASGWRQRFPELLIDDEHVGVWNRRATLASVLRDGDRVEIHRPLVADPKLARRQRAEANPVGVQARRKISRS